jgi:hypothetical protein
MEPADSAHEPPDDPRSEQRILRDESNEAWEATDWDPPDSSNRRAIRAYLNFLERRVRQLERTIEDYLETLPADVLRTELLFQLYGTRPATTRDRNLLTTTERRLINHYNQMAASDRQMARRLFEHLTKIGDVEPTDDGDGGAR